MGAVTLEGGTGKDDFLIFFDSLFSTGSSISFLFSTFFKRMDYYYNYFKDFLIDF